VDCDFTSDTLHGLKFFAETDNDFTGSGTTLLNCVIRECGGAGIRLFKGGPTAQDPGYGLQATNVNVWGTQFYLNTGDDIDDDGGTENPTYFHQWDISGNKFMTKDKTTYLDLNTGTGGGDECLVSNNYFAGTINTTTVQLPTDGMAVGNHDVTGEVGTIPAP
jgi:hypothetical protein